MTEPHEITALRADAVATLRQKLSSNTSYWQNTILRSNKDRRQQERIYQAEFDEQKDRLEESFQKDEKRLQDKHKVSKESAKFESTLKRKELENLFDKEKNTRKEAYEAAERQAKIDNQRRLEHFDSSAAAERKDLANESVKELKALEDKYKAAISGEKNALRALKETAMAKGEYRDKFYRTAGLAQDEALRKVVIDKQPVFDAALCQAPRNVANMHSVYPGVAADSVNVASLAISWPADLVLHEGVFNYPPILTPVDYRRMTSVGDQVTKEIQDRERKQQNALRHLRDDDTGSADAKCQKITEHCKGGVSETSAPSGFNVQAMHSSPTHTDFTPRSELVRQANGPDDYIMSYPNDPSRLFDHKLKLRCLATSTHLFWGVGGQHPNATVISTITKKSSNSSPIAIQSSSTILS